MYANSQFSNLCGTVYTRGNLCFTPDGNSLLSPVGNRLSLFDLVNNKSITFPFENQKNISRIALSPNANILLSVDEDGRVLLVNFQRRIVLHEFNFKSPVTDVQFSPDGKFFGVALGKNIQVWKSPGLSREFAPFVMHHKYTGHYDEVTSITWSTDSRFFLSTSKDMTAKLHSLFPIEDFATVTLSGHKNYVIGAYFSKDQNMIYTVSKDGALFIWKFTSPQTLTEDDEQHEEMDIDDVEPELSKSKRWTISSRHYFNQSGAKVICSAYHASSNLLVVGFSSGIFGIWEMPEFNNIHTLSISQKAIDSVTINSTGEWLAFGSSKLGQLLVWEWQSESYVLKQQGHYYDMNTLSYSSDGQNIATGGDDGKVKVWNTMSGFCFVTFSEHTSGVSVVEFSKNGHVLFSASLDGTVRAFDLIRYRNFRTFTSPSPVQFTSLAVDPSGEIVCAGSMDTFEIFVWSVQTGKLLDIMAGHEGPISGLTFSPTGLLVASSSWDSTVRVWNVFERSKHVEVFRHTSDVLTVVFRPDGKQLASSTLDGQITFWNVENGDQVGTVEGRKDISGGRKANDRTTAANSSSGKSFNSICYTADGSCVISGGNSKYICLYDVKEKLLIKKYQISHNLSLDGIQEFLNSKYMTEAGPLDLIDQSGDLSDLEDRLDTSLPGTQKGDLSVRKTRPEIRTKCVKFSPTGRSWAAASTEGLLIYSLDELLLFDPFDLEMDITPSSILKTLNSKDYLKALVMSFRLNERYIIRQVYETIPPDDIELVVKDLPEKYIDKFFKFIAVNIEESPHLEFHLLWIIKLLTTHGKYLKQRSNEFSTILRLLQKGVGKVQEDIAKL
ncbi:23585_t:CDS:2 [Dentiscutata erythropus]|uniref:23585_t:CDS:1 n=1 Tax=Dentiscutata erythropus TaxID=1348616 RepID=A0A9N9B6J0_9GLOM|nr:23585_t:CDS:2 [Dentiscutata erythropus]